MKFSIKNFFSKYDQTRRKMWICSHLLKKPLMENFTFCAVRYFQYRYNYKQTQFWVNRLRCYRRFFLESWYLDYLGQVNVRFCYRCSQENYFWWVGRSIGKIIVFVSFRVGTSQNKNIANRVKEICAIISNIISNHYIISNIISINTNYIWNRSHLLTPWFNNVKSTKVLFFMYTVVILKKKIMLEEI